MSLPITGPDGPTVGSGCTYAGIFVCAERAGVLGYLAERRFSGWLGPQECDWVLAVPEEVVAAVAGDGTDLLALAVGLARRLGTVTVAARVERDRVLRLDAWDGTDDQDTQEPEHLGSYLSDPTVDAPDEEVYPEPVGAHHAPRYAEACGHPEVSDELTELLAEELDPESVFESERLDSVLRLLDLPRWLVAVTSLPGDVPSGPRRSELVRLGAGREGVTGRVAGAMTGVVRRRLPRLRPH
ncbi:MAG: hypothetical protein WAL50_15320 [Kineosporiaceae bacterium]